VDRRVDLSTFVDGCTDRADLTRIRNRVAVTVDRDLAYNDHEAAIAVTTADGTTHSRAFEHPPESIENPMSAD
jgi:hypothetical protein